MQSNYMKSTNLENCRRWFRADTKWYHNMEEWLPVNKNLKWRDDDVIILAYHRCGTHMLGHIVKMILADDIEKSLEYPIENIGISWFCYKDDQAGRRVLASHITPFELGDDAFLKGHRKFIHVIRDPKPTCVSMYLLHQNMNALFEDPGSFESYAMAYAKGGPQILDIDWVTQTRAIEEYIDRHPEAQILQIRFDDVIKDMAGMIKKLANYLDVKLSDDRLKEIAEASNFKNMKTAVVGEEMKTMSSGKEPTFYRKGKSDDWKNHFTVALNERFDAEIARRMAGSKTQIGK